MDLEGELKVMTFASCQFGIHVFFAVENPRVPERFPTSKPQLRRSLS
jgi:hypothetical protein